jgi:hypothetical protein
VSSRTLPWGAGSGTYFSGMVDGRKEVGEEG